MLSEINQRKTNTAWSYLHIESKTKQKRAHRYREQTGCRRWGAREGVGKINEQGQRDKLSVINKSWGCNVQHGDCTWTAYLKVAERLNLKSSDHKKRNFSTYVWWWMLTRCTVVIISQSIQIMNHHIAHLKLVQCYVSIISKFLKRHRFPPNIKLQTCRKRRDSSRTPGVCFQLKSWPFS